jgi:hypothetical protein
MKKMLFATAFLLSTALLTTHANAADEKAPQQKEWTFLLFLNGHNNLDSYGAYNINQMEEVGSSNDLNMVVQWASLANKKTQRMLIQKDNNTSQVTSPVVETMAPVDMGDYKQLVEFVRWGVEKYPAKHYFIAVWNHGNGWHRMNTNGNSIVRDISYDDISGNHITTEQLGLAMAESAKIIGHKVDVYGSDACLMAMAEVAGEMKNSVDFMVGSEEVEPGYGWPYNTFMARWSERPQQTPAEVATALTEEYTKAYDGGIYGEQDVTFSAMDLSKLDGLFTAMKNLKTSMASLSAADMKTVKTAASSTQSFTYSDYRDLSHFTSKIAATSIGVNSSILADINSSIKELVISSGATGMYANTAKGISVWMPTSASTLSTYSARYSALEVNKSTDWLSFLQKLNK